MNHITEEQLILHYYGEDMADIAQVDQHLADVPHEEVVRRAAAAFGAGA